ncbi:MAG TPA: amidohydrolase family protein [Xanthobacteraceae bacterium]|nr:amidohydrolase family protein [Xanthobacteraceae bacterium]
MIDHAIGRRTLLTAAAAAAVTGTLGDTGGRAQPAVPNTTGTDPAKIKAPANAADCHMHVYDPRFPESNPRPGQNPKNATVSDYRLLQKRTGTARVVVVQPRNYATDNRVTIDALKQLGASARGVAVVHPTVTDAELRSFNDAGIRGIRFSLGGANAVVTWDMVEPLSKRVNELGWHVQFNVDGDDIVTHADLLRRLPSQTVFDHLGHPPLPAGTDHLSHAVLRGLLDRGRTWIKLSGAYSNSKIGPPGYPEATRVAQAFVKAAPERLVWGSDWPHPSEQNRTLPDDALLFDLLAVWAPEEATRKRILVENPENLYGFAKIF